MAGIYDRNRYLTSAARALERLLNQTEIGEPDRRLMDGVLRDAIASSGPALVRTFTGMRCFLLASLQAPGQFGWRGRSTPSTSTEKAVTALVDFTARMSGVRDRQTIRVLTILEQVIVRARNVGVNDWEAIKEVLPTSETIGRSDQLAEAREYWNNTVISGVELVTRLRLAQVALAIEAYRSAHQGEVPSSLSELRSFLPPGLPFDPFTGHLIRYSRLEKGYVVYSVGRDKEDNGGIDPPTSVRRLKNHDIAFRVER